jgi:predicted esterase
MMREHHFPVARTARYVTLGEPRQGLRELWFVCHGYGQLAARFLRRFASLDDGHRLIVAPEALSRFYVEPATGGSHAHAMVGASWMTREDRLSEIDDYIRYLDALYAQVMQEVGGAELAITVLGFSQGVATACRWIAHGVSRADRLILWGGLLPPDLDLATASPVLRSIEVIVVVGESDDSLSSTALAEQRERLTEIGVEHRSVSYAGGHRIDDEVLARLADAPAGGRRSTL